MAEEEKEKTGTLTVESRMYKLNELKNRMSNDLVSYQNIIPKYEALIDIIDKSGRESELPDDFVQSVQDDLKKIQDTISYIEHRLVCINYLLEINNRQDEDSKKLEEWTSVLFDALGIYDEPETNSPQPTEE